MDKIIKIIVVLALVAIIVSTFNSYLVIQSASNIQQQLNQQEEESERIFNEQNEQIESLQTTLNETKSVLEDFETKLDTLEEQNSNQQEKINTLQLELDQDLLDLEEKIDQMEPQTPAEVYDAVHKSVVLISTPWGQGSGFLFGNSGTIVTNYHVVTTQTRIEIQYFDGSRTNATIIGSDPYSDLAILEVEMIPDGAEPLVFGDQTINVGQKVVAIGNPLGSTDSLSVGYISQVNKLIDIPPIIIPVFQLDLTITFGSSGGPLLDLSGNLIGVTNAGTSYGLNYAVPLNILERVIPALISEGEYKHPFVGVSIIALTPQLITEINISNIDRYQNGLLVVDVFPEYPAQKAGLLPVVYEDEGIRAVDIILSIDDFEVLTLEDWSKYMETQISPEETITLTVWRAGEIISVDVTTTERPPYS
ncbi:MAG: serine protease [Candidatus Bathyarchaeota archaeon]|nr:S1C family serine protease [Candidatus Bathyarchaeum tardum]WGM88653.1 MAG: S1C family serine protease [Candidatus Bathyarchaeum tardum]WNZ29088.1 MAG: serine protease [Candidatus Bathyarchaeota archaeon]